MKPIEKSKATMTLPEINTPIKVGEILGNIIGYAAGTGGDIWVIRHTDGSIKNYSYLDVTDVV